MDPLSIILALLLTFSVAHDALESPETKEVTKEVYIKVPPRRLVIAVPKIEKQQKLPAFNGRDIVMVKKSDVSVIIQNKAEANKCEKYVNEVLPKLVDKFNKQEDKK